MSERETSSNRGANQYTPDDENFEALLKSKCPEIKRSTAYRWMDAAKGMVGVLVHNDMLTLPEGVRWNHALPRTHALLGEKLFLISDIMMASTQAGDGKVMDGMGQQVLLALHEFLYGPEGEPRVIKRNGREKVQIGYLTSHSLRDIICSVNGKEKGGKGEGQKADRADFSRFVVNHFRQITVIQRKWAKAAATNPIKRAEMITGLRSLILGELAIIPLTGKSEGVVENEKVLPPWDREFSELMMDLLKERLYKKNRERIDGPELVDNRPQPAHPLLEQEYARAENWE